MLKAYLQSPGAATGEIVFTAEKAKKNDTDRGKEKSSWFAKETSPEDIEGMIVSEAIVTSRGGMTSHCRVARGMGTCCVTGTGNLDDRRRSKTVTTK